MAMKEKVSEQEAYDAYVKTCRSQPDAYISEFSFSEWRAMGRPISCRAVDDDDTGGCAVTVDQRDILWSSALKEMRDEAAHRFGVKTFTCDDCMAVGTCRYKFDPYNTDGDCLAEK